MFPSGRSGAGAAEGSVAHGTQAVSNDVVLTYAIQPMFDDEMQPGAADDL